MLVPTALLQACPRLRHLELRDNGAGLEVGAALALAIGGDPDEGLGHCTVHHGWEGVNPGIPNPAAMNATSPRSRARSASAAAAAAAHPHPHAHSHSHSYQQQQQSAPGPAPSMGGASLTTIPALPLPREQYGHGHVAGGYARSLQELDVGDNPLLGDVGVSKLAEGLGRNPGSLRVLALEGVGMGPSGAAALAHALEEQRLLVEAVAAAARAASPQGRRRATASVTSLASLGVPPSVAGSAGGSAGPGGASPGKRAGHGRGPPSTTSLSTYSPGVSSSGAGSLPSAAAAAAAAAAASAAPGVGLAALRISRNPIRGQGATALATALPAAAGLVELELEGCQVRGTCVRSEECV